ncbi:hypothetical protein BD324DRAFT_657206 [Kockovaella imperatae]|uniref:Magnesium transporter NIPA-domain-containing protein n=1 Tax=Kockovaella imperatae TaxID=4999 RepID=A0A1Y1UDZ4_9TREE|nr:hypothetical protein BD324DRAFT_657206 [Kockovaella imperatae]ORX35726.1 hypothetical protein BD324DRAFT_657206 [Kockovaella imperatae]
MGGIPVAVAIIVGLVSSFVQSLGLTIQRKSHVQEDDRPLEFRRRPIRRPMWLLGFTIYITSNVFSTVFQLDALPIVILAPLGAVSLIFNALLAKILLGDHFGPSSVIGTGLVTVGAVLIAVFGVVQEKEHSLDDLLELWKRPAFLAFFSILTFAVVTLLIAAHMAVWHVQRQLRPGKISISGRDTPPDSSPPSNYASPHDPPPIPFRQNMGNRRWSSPASPQTHPSHFRPLIADSTADVKNPTLRHVHFAPSLRSLSKGSTSLNIEIAPSTPNGLAHSTSSQDRTLTLAGLAFAAASGTLSGMSLVLAKAAVELLVITIDHFRTGRGENQFIRVQSWLLVSGLAVGAILQLAYLNYSLTFASPALICPLAFCFFNLSSIFDGLVFYDQFGSLRPYQIALVSIGVAILLVGVWVVSLIRPAGQGGIEVGTWVEDDESVCDGADPTDGFSVFGEDINDDPEEIVSPMSDQPIDHTTPPRLSQTTSSQPPSPTSPTSLLSPLSPGARRRHPPRYGTLISEYAPLGAPTGFSIGLGAASPGFVLRSSSLNSGTNRRTRGRTQSESEAGIQAIISDEVARLRQAREAQSDLSRRLSETANTTLLNDEADDLTGSGHGRRRSWWREVWARKQRGPIQLPPDEG